MPRGPHPCTQAAITRMIKAALAAGVGREHIVLTVNRDGATMRFSEHPVEVTLAKSPANEASIAADDSWSDIDAA